MKCMLTNRIASSETDSCQLSTCFKHCPLCAWGYCVAWWKQQRREGHPRVSYLQLVHQSNRPNRHGAELVLIRKDWLVQHIIACNGRHINDEVSPFGNSPS